MFADQLIDGTDLRVSYEAWHDISNGEHLVDPITKERSKEYIRTMLDQFNIRAANTSKIIEEPLMVCEVLFQEHRPNVLLFNAANAHALFNQKSRVFKKWMQDLQELTSDVVMQQG